MSWVRRDDQASIHRKVAPLDDATYRLWSEAIEWCSRNGTDGVIRAEDLPDVSKRASRARAGKLVDRVLWHAADDPPCPSEKCVPPGPDGWVVHDFLDYNPSRAQVVADRKVKAERTARWRDKRRGGDASRDASSNGSRDASQGHHVTVPPVTVPPVMVPPVMVPRPAPSRPAPKEAGAGPPKRTPAADGGAAAAGSEEDHKTRVGINRCHDCGNPPDSPYHRNVCHPARSA